MRKEIIGETTIVIMVPADPAELPSVQVHWAAIPAESSFPCAHRDARLDPKRVDISRLVDAAFELAIETEERLDGSGPGDVVRRVPLEVIPELLTEPEEERTP